MQTACWSKSKKHVYWRNEAGETSWATPEPVGLACYDKASSAKRAFGSERDELRLASNRWKSDLLSTHVRPQSLVLDIGCGRGGDFGKYAKSRVSQVFGIDASPHALAEAMNRAQTYGLPVRLVLGDVTRQTPAFAVKVDVIVCMFALHYFVETDEAIQNLAKLIGTHAKHTTRLIGIAPDPRNVRHRLENDVDDATIELEPVSDLKYRCRILSDSGDVLVDAVEKVINWPRVEKVFEDVAGLMLERLQLNASACESLNMYNAFVFLPLERLDKSLERYIAPKKRAFTSHPNKSNRNARGRGAKRVHFDTRSIRPKD